MKKILFCFLALLLSPSAFAACAKSTTKDTWTLFAEINKFTSIVGKGTLVVAPTGVVDARKSSMTLVWKLFPHHNAYPLNANTTKTVPLSGTLAVDAQCNVTGVIKTTTPIKKKTLQFTFSGKLDSVNKREVNGVFYALNVPGSLVNGRITALKN